MSEVKHDMKAKLSRKNWLTIFYCGIGITAFDIQYLARNFYVIWKDSSGMTDGQMGIMLSAIGVAATIAYFYNGFISDMIKPRTILIFAYTLCTAASLVLMTMPGFIPSMIIFVGFALTPLWCPMSKLLAETTPDELSGQVFGWLDSFNGLTGLLVGLLGSFAVSMFDSTVGIRLIIAAHATMSALSLVGVIVITKGTNNTVKVTKKEESSSSEDDKFSIKNVLILIKDPNQWYAWLGIAFGYTGYIGLTYLSPLLVEYFGVSTAAITVLDTIRQNAITLFIPIIAGVLSDKFGAVKSYFLWLGFYIVSMVAVLLIPWAPVFYLLGILCVILLACSVKGRSPLSNSILTGIRTPLHLFGTSVGLECVLMMVPDIFAYTLAGNLIDRYGANGYRYVFIGCLGFAVLGLICNVLLDRRVKAGKTSDVFFESLAHRS